MKTEDMMDIFQNPFACSNLSEEDKRIIYSKMAMSNSGLHIFFISYMAVERFNIGFFKDGSAVFPEWTGRAFRSKPLCVKVKQGVRIAKRAHVR